LLLAAWQSPVMPELLSSLPLAGYALDHSGERWIVVFLINDPHSHLDKPAMDARLRWVMER
jgi:D-alanyl-D-alanine carboxypeptidase/D-alanyl-D-alanine-endopeptidase (penicillin-binding protein 4)